MGLTTNKHITRSRHGRQLWEVPLLDVASTTSSTNAETFVGDLDPFFPQGKKRFLVGGIKDRPRILIKKVVSTRLRYDNPPSIFQSLIPLVETSMISVSSGGCKWHCSAVKPHHRGPEKP